MKEKRINIMGSGPGWEATPIDEGEIWGVNNTHLLRNVDRIIDIHNRVDPEEKKDQLHMKELRAKAIPTYSRDRMRGFDNVRKYPLAEIMEEFATDYFGSGVDYVIALAIYEGVTDIHLYGVNMMTDGEYAHQKASVEYWIGIAKGRGINVEVHGVHSVILKTRNGLMYGYQEYQKFVTDENPGELSMNDLIEMYE